MTRSLIVKSAMALFTLLLGGCAGGPGNNIQGSGKVTTESRNVSGFDEVSLSGTGNLTITRTGTESLTIEAEDNIIPYLKTDVANNRLTIGTKDNVSIQPTRPISYNLTVKDLSALDLSGSGKINASDISNLSQVTLSGSGNMDASGISSDKLIAQISGSGQMRAAGKAGSQDVRISGSGSYQADNLESKEARLEVSGSGHSTINVSDKLDVKISGSGSVEYIGNPTVTQDVSGSGRLGKR
jgi:Putative auto-transporter adhesin, head GIN domain